MLLVQFLYNAGETPYTVARVSCLHLFAPGGFMATESVMVNDKKEIFGWAMYDWANSAFSTTVGTVFLGPFVASLARTAAEAAGTTTVSFLGIPVAPCLLYTSPSPRDGL